MRLPPWIWKMLHSRRTKVVLASSPFVACALIASAYPITNWIAGRAVDRYIAELVRDGHAINPENYWTTDRPEDDVFRHPVMVLEMEAPVIVTPASREPAISGLARRPPRRKPEFAEGIDARLWFDPPEKDERSAAERLLREMEGPVRRLEDLREALDRPTAAWPVGRQKSPLSGREIPEIATRRVRLMRIAQISGDVGTLQLAAGNAKAAAGNISSTFRITTLFLEPKPSLISILMAERSLQHAVDVVWEGVLREAWTDGELREFDREAAALRPQQAASRSHLGEIAFAGWKAEEITALMKKQHPAEILKGWEWDLKRVAARGRAIWRGARPSGIGIMMFVNNERISCHQVANSSSGPRTHFSAADLRIFRQRHESFPDAYYAGGGTRKDTDAESWYYLGKVAETALRTEARIALLRTGIALERFRLAEGHMPAKLDELTPEYLPTPPLDPFDGNALRYRLQSDGSPHIWSIGQDLVDEGGLPHFQRNDKGDLIWIVRPISGFKQRDLIR